MYRVFLTNKSDLIDNSKNTLCFNPQINNDSFPEIGIVETIPGIFMDTIKHCFISAPNIYQLDKIPSEFTIGGYVSISDIHDDINTFVNELTKLHIGDKIYQLRKGIKEYDDILFIADAANNFNEQFKQEASIEYVVFVPIHNSTHKRPYRAMPFIKPEVPYPAVVTPNHNPNPVFPDFTANQEQESKKEKLRDYIIPFYTSHDASSSGTVFMSDFVIVTNTGSFVIRKDIENGYDNYHIYTHPGNIEFSEEIFNTLLTELKELEWISENHIRDLRIGHAKYIDYLKSK